MFYQPQVFSEKPTEAMNKKWESEIRQALKALDQELVKTSHLCGDVMTLGDLLVFSDLLQYIEINGFNEKSPELKDYENLMRWYSTKMMAKPQLKQVVEEFREALKKAKPAKLS